MHKRGDNVDMNITNTLEKCRNDLELPFCKALSPIMTMSLIYKLLGYSTIQKALMHAMGISGRNQSTHFSRGEMNSKLHLYSDVVLFFLFKVPWLR